MTDYSQASSRDFTSFLVGPRRKAIAVALVCCAFFCAVWWAGHYWYRATLLVEARGDMLSQLDPYGNALTIDLRRRFDIIHGLAAWVSTQQSTAHLSANFEAFAAQLSNGVPGIRNLNIAPDGVVRFVYPRADNEAIVGRDLKQDSRAGVREEVARAITSRKMVISGPLQLVVGGIGAVARLALFRQEKFWGLVNVVLELPPILHEAGITKQKHFQLALRDRNGRVLFGEKAVFDVNPTIHRVELPDSHWELAAIPIMGWEGAIHRDLRNFDFAALTIAFLLSAIAYLIAFRGARLSLRVKEGTRDLTAELERRKIVENELGAAQERYKSLVELNPDAVLVIFKMKIVYSNNAALGLFRAKSLHDLLGRSPLELVEQQQRAEVESQHHQTLLSGAPIQPHIQRRLRLDGSPIFVEIVAAPVPWEGEKAVQVIMRDLSDQRKVERSLRGLIDATQDAVICIDRQARIVMFNKAAEHIFGYMKSDVWGQKVNMLMPEPYASEHDSYIARFESTGEARAIGSIRNLSARRKNGETFPIELSLTQIITGDEVSYTAFIRDISEKVRLQEKAMENERLATIGTMAAKFGHELGNPLNGMSLTIQLLEQRLRKQGDDLDHQVSGTLSRLKSEIARLNTLLQDFRSLSRKETYNFQSSSLAGLVSEAIEIEIPHFTEKKVEVESRFGAELPRVTVDIDKMKQVILNLAKNAVEAMPQGGRLSFSGATANGTVTLEVSDTGAGIPAEIDIFEPFFTTKSFGTGIGLTIVRQIIAAHGGTISYRSEPGKGTIFTIRLPVG